MKTPEEKVEENEGYVTVCGGIPFILPEFEEFEEGEEEECTEQS